MSFDEQSLAVAQFEPGSVIAGRYEILRPIGSGGMAFVYLAKDLEQDDFEVAVKTLHSEFVGQQQYVDRFIREAQLLNKIDHPNIVKLYEIGTEQGIIFFTMEYVEGQSLAELMDQYVFSEDHIAHFIIQMCQGLSVIHSNGITHRDMKPGNILVTEDGQVKISDFGMAREKFSRLTAENQIVGSVCYMAPEIWRGDEVTPFVDFYSLGIMLYELATGEVPFENAWPAELMRMHIYEPPPQPIDKNPDLPPWLNELVVKLLQKYPHERPSSNEEIIEFVKNARNRSKLGEGAAAANGGAAGSFETSDAPSVTRRPRGKTYVLKLNASREIEDPSRIEARPSTRSKTSLTIPLFSNKEFVVEIEKPSRDLVYLLAFLLSLQVFDVILTGFGISRFGASLESVPMLSDLMLNYGADKALILVKLVCILAVAVMTFFTRRRKGVKNMIGLVSTIYLLAALGPWLCFLFLEYKSYIFP